MASAREGGRVQATAVSFAPPLILVDGAVTECPAVFSEQFLALFGAPSEQVPGVRCLAEDRAPRAPLVADTIRITA